jgi:putative transcriptional regulator
MKKGLFEELLESIREAGAIARGELEPARVTKFEAVNARATRETFGITQLAFSRMIGVSLGTLRNWEQGRRHPHGPARVLLLVAAAHPDMVRRVIEQHRRGINHWKRESRVLAFAPSRPQTGSRTPFSDPGYAPATPVSLKNLGGSADDRASASA